jgi:non-canonical purine NTP pyrophosphatase (RdgB/HAM1 family)
MQQLPVLITGNPNKAKYVAQWLGIELEHQKLDLDEVQSLDLQEVVEHKVRQAYRLAKRPVIVEDAALILPAMGRLPGTFVKWFLDELGVKGLGELAARLSSAEAVGVLKYAYYDGKELQIFDGSMHGRLIAVPRGSGGFGFDAIFVNDGYDITRAEMDEEAYALTSYRKEALDKLAQYLTKA